MSIKIIAALSTNRIIGKKSQIPWFIRGELKRFKDITMGHNVVMGRKTYESIGKILDGRRNVIITKNKNYKADGCIVVNNILDSLKALSIRNYEEVFVIGGGEIYKRFLENDLIDRMYITHIDESFDGDTFFPKVDYNKWDGKTIMNHTKDKENPHNFRVTVYEKNN